MTDELQAAAAAARAGAGADDAEGVAFYRTTAKVHSYHEGDVVVTATLPNDRVAQVTTQGATVELIDGNGSGHTHRFLDVDKARAVFGAGEGTEIECVYALVGHGPAGAWTPQHATAAADAQAEPNAQRPTVDVTVTGVEPAEAV